MTAWRRSRCWSASEWTQSSPTSSCRGWTATVSAMKCARTRALKAVRAPSRRIPAWHLLGEARRAARRRAASGPRPGSGRSWVAVRTLQEPRLRALLRQPTRAYQREARLSADQECLRDPIRNRAVVGSIPTCGSLSVTDSPMVAPYIPGYFPASVLKRTCCAGVASGRTSRFHAFVGSVDAAKRSPNQSSASV